MKEEVNLNILSNKILQLEQQLEHNNTFLACAVHELNKYIHHVYFFSDYLVDQGPKLKQAQQMEYIQTIMESSLHLRRLSEDLLDLSSIPTNITKNDLKNDFSNLNLLDIINESIKYFKRTSVLNKDLQIQFQDNGITEANVNGNSNHIKQVFNNLLDNAVKYGNKGVILINLELKKQNMINYWQLTFTDQGAGIPEDELETIFQPFFRSKKIKALPGHGLGLSICQKIAEQHNGILTAKNNADQGATFYFSLPAI